MSDDERGDPRGPVPDEDLSLPKATVAKMIQGQYTVKRVCEPARIAVLMIVRDLYVQRSCPQT